MITNAFRINAEKLGLQVLHLAPASACHLRFLGGLHAVQSGHRELGNYSLQDDGHLGYTALPLV